MGGLRPSLWLGAAGPSGVDLRLTVQPLVRGALGFGVSVAHWSRGANELPCCNPGGIAGTSGASEDDIDVYTRAYYSGFDPQATHQVFTGFVGGIVGVHRREYKGTLEGWAPYQVVGPATTNAGVEPGAEMGLRITPHGNFFFEIGGRARLITFEDPTGRFTKGQIDPRLTLSVGVGW